MNGSVEAVRDFFEEHPIHSFTTSAIAEYLGVSEASTQIAIKILLRLGLIETRYQKVL